MNVTIMYRNSYHGGDGWTYYPLLVTIMNNCPKCGAPRGKPKPHNQCEDGEFFCVDVWNNPCGHLDSYKDVYFESRKELTK
jgi:hypothetical protein